MIRASLLYFDSETTKLELDFLIQKDNLLIPIEVKAEENLKSKSLKQFYIDNPDSHQIGRAHV